MSTAIATKRVIMELTPVEQYFRALQNLFGHRSAAHARVDAHFADKARELQVQYFGASTNGATVPTDMAAPASEPIPTT